MDGVIGWQPYDPCPCLCGVVSHKLAVKTGHAVGCGCRSCTGRRNRRKGRAAETKAHRAAGGIGVSPVDEFPAVRELHVVWQVKQGQQAPANFVRFIESEWFRHALSQAQRIIPEGVQADPAVNIQPAGGGMYAVVEIVPRPRTRMPSHE